MQCMNWNPQIVEEKPNPLVVNLNGTSVLQESGLLPEPSTDPGVRKFEGLRERKADAEFVAALHQ